MNHAKASFSTEIFACAIPPPDPCYGHGQHQPSGKQLLREARLVVAMLVFLCRGFSGADPSGTYSLCLEAADDSFGGEEAVSERVADDVCLRLHPRIPLPL
jgi:hypothetical protein